jgi:hypothetical protein
MTPFRQEIDRLAKDYPAFVIVSTRVYNGERVAAYRQDQSARDGLYAVIGTPQEVETELAKAVAELRASLGCQASSSPTIRGKLAPNGDPLFGDVSRTGVLDARRDSREMATDDSRDVAHPSRIMPLSLK